MTTQLQLINIIITKKKTVHKARTNVMLNTYGASQRSKSHDMLRWNMKGMMGNNIEGIMCADNREVWRAATASQGVLILSWALYITRWVMGHYCHISHITMK